MNQNMWKKMSCNNLWTMDKKNSKNFLKKDLFAALFLNI